MRANGASPEAALEGRGVRTRVIRADLSNHRPTPDIDAPALRVPRPLELLHPQAWTGAPPARRWIVKDWIPRGVVTALYGDGGIGKSLLAQHLLTSTALGRPWLGIEAEGGRALGVFCEDDPDELHRRQAAINAAIGAEPDELGALRLLSRVGAENVLMDFSASDRGALTDFFADLDATLRTFKPVLLSLDTAADLFGGNENIRPQVRRFIGSCLARLAQTHDCGVLLLAHPSAAGLRDGSGTGGSTAWNNTVRSRLYFTRPGEEEGAGNTNRRVLTRMKANYAPRDERLDLEWHAGAFRLWTSTAGDPATWEAIGAMFDEMERAWSAGRAWSYRPETRAGGRYFPSWAARKLGVPERRTADLLSDWLLNGCLAFEVFDARAKTRGLRVLRRPDQ